MKKATLIFLIFAAGAFAGDDAKKTAEQNAADRTDYLVKHIRYLEARVSDLSMRIDTLSRENASIASERDFLAQASGVQKTLTDTQTERGSALEALKKYCKVGKLDESTGQCVQPSVGELQKSFTDAQAAHANALEALKKACTGKLDETTGECRETPASPAK